VIVGRVENFVRFTVLAAGRKNFDPVFFHLHADGV
jgi:hypothetical protein